MTTTIFIRLLAAVDKPTALCTAAHTTRVGAAAPNVYSADPTAFRQIPGSPFAYWVSETIREVFARHRAMEGSTADVRVGLSTKDDVRFVRAWWEVPEKSLGKQSIWVPFAKGGAYSTYYADVHLVVDWANDGKELKLAVSEKNRLQSGNPSWSRWISAADYYFRAGLTYPRRTNGFSVRAMPAGCIFADKGPAMFVMGDGERDLMALLAVVNSAPFNKLLSLLLGRVELAQSFEVGLIQQMPVPNLSAEDERAIAAQAREAHDLKREADRDNEVTHPFTAPAVARLRDVSARALAGALAALGEEAEERERRLAEIQREIDDLMFALYGFSAEDRAQVERGEAVMTVEDGETENNERGDGEEDEAEATPAGIGQQRLRVACADLVMYTVGCAFGRWDARIGRDLSLAPSLADPFAPLPACAPGALVGPDGLPATSGRIVSEEWLRARPDAISLPPAGSITQTTIGDGAYPLPLAWDGILPDDPEHSADIMRQVRATLDLFWGDRAETIEREIGAALGVRDLRDWFRAPRGFFDHHIGRYSKSRRKAPIYWLLQSPGKQYGLWVYYHRLDRDLLFKALTNYVQPKLRLEETRLIELQTARQRAGASGPESRRAAQAIERQEALLSDLREFHDRLDRAAKLYLTPDLNDGVTLTIAPLWELVPWKEAKNAWEQLLAGKYAWSSIGKQLREKGLVKAK